MACTDDGATFTGSSRSQFENKPDAITQLPEVASTLAGFLDCLFPNPQPCGCTVLNAPENTIFLAYLKMAVDDTEQFACSDEVGFLIFNSPSLFFLRTFIHVLLTAEEIVCLLSCFSRAITDLLEGGNVCVLRHIYDTVRLH